MDVSTITMPQDAAAAKLQEYRSALRRRNDAEYERARVAYESLAAGRALLILSDVIATAPRDGKGRPMLAIARADRRQVHYRRRLLTRQELFDANRRNGAGWTVGRWWPQYLITVPIGAAAPALVGEPEGYAIVPLVPPAVARGHDLAKRFILWEVESWSDRPLLAVPDRDPYLLQRIADDLYAVVGEWDLTDVERAVMRDRVRG